MKKLKRSTKWIIASILAVVVFVILYLLALFVPNSIYRNSALYPFWFIECGHQPVLGSSYREAGYYYLPGDEGYSPHIFIDTHFCSEEEARAAGYKHISDY